jgi:phosphoglycerate dehydrogenase-like enzyme
MRIVLCLSNPIRAFQPNAAQIARLREGAAPHELCAVETEAELLTELPHADIVVVWQFLSKWYGSAPRLRHVFTPSAGRERIALDDCARVSCHFGQFHGSLMAESLLGMMLFLNRRLGVALERQSARDFDRHRYEGLRRLRGQTALIVGYGAIGRHAGELLNAVGMRVFGVRRDASRAASGVERLFAASELHEALALADHIACILPLETGTDKLLDRAAFSAMKRSAFVYNLGRGNAIDTEALRDTLNSGRIAGAFLDVVPEEPLPPSSPLWATPNLYLTPHASAIYEEYLDLYFAELAGVFSKL